MASSVQVRNINPVGAIVTFIDGEQRDVAAGEVITVSPEAAGEPPAWRQVAKLDDAEQPVQEVGREYREHAGHLEVRELGTGLLAQEGNWERVTARSASSDDDSKGDA